MKKVATKPLELNNVFRRPPKQGASFWSVQPIVPNSSHASDDQDPTHESSSLDPAQHSLRASVGGPCLAATKYNKYEQTKPLKASSAIFIGLSQTCRLVAAARVISGQQTWTCSIILRAGPGLCTLMWVWIKIKPPGIGPQVLVHGSIYQGKPFWAHIFDPRLCKNGVTQEKGFRFDPRLWLGASE